MDNVSILNAFEKLWLNVIAKLGEKADVGHTHDDLATKQYVDNAIGNAIGGSY